MSVEGPVASLSSSAEELTMSFLSFQIKLQISVKSLFTEENESA